MKIIKFRIRNFKSIIDSGDCYLSDSITILAGKNEAGKSSILEALFDFNAGTPIREKSIPLNFEKSLPEVSVVFDLSKEEFQGIFKDADIDLDVKKLLVERLPENYLVEIKKLYPDKFTISGKIFEAVNTTIQVLAKKLTDDIKLYAASNGLSENKPLRTLLAILQSENIIESNEIQKNISFFQSEVGSPTSNITVVQKDSLTKLSSEIQSSLDELKNLYCSLQTTINSEILKRIPNFILFNSFEDVFPNEVNFSELESNPWITDLCKMSNLDISIVTGTNNPIKKQHKHLLNIKLNKDFSQYWTQDLSQLSIDWDGSILSFWIEEDGNFYPPELRSQGRRWHLAFYVKVSAKSKAGTNTVILIDEPGLYLHATAQRDILKHLEDSSEHNQILMSTHSPYLIEPDKLERIRLVQKSNTKGTRIENKIHAVSDKETLTPILTAIGLELNQGIANSEKTIT
jgi:predicted ATP-dependent endonuclease of OLD family